MPNENEMHLLGLDSAVLLINPSSRTNVGPVLRSKVLVLIVNSVIIHEFVKLGKVKERDHRVAMVLHVVVGIPQELTNNGVGLDGASVAKHVDFVHFTIGMFGIANVVDGTVANDYRNNPPKEDGLKALLGLSKESKDCNVAEELNSSSLLEVLDMNQENKHPSSCSSQFQSNRLEHRRQH